MVFPENDLPKDESVVLSPTDLGCPACSEETWQKFIQGGLELSEQELQELQSEHPATLASVAAVNPIRKPGA